MRHRRTVRILSSVAVLAWIDSLVLIIPVALEIHPRVHMTVAIIVAALAASMTVAAVVAAMVPSALAAWHIALCDSREESSRLRLVK